MHHRDRIHFPGLNGLRFFAALFVVITHIELSKFELEMPNSWQNTYIFNLGGLGVYFFFVLSGFLITYLLLAEKKLTETISIKHFYIRRIYRIWPLYYLMVILAFFVFPNIDFLKHEYYHQFLENHFWTKLLLFIFILPNLCLAMYHNIPHVGHSWSIGVEEQFYLIWPIILKYSKNALKTIILFTIIWISLKGLVLLSYKIMGGSLGWLTYLKLFFAMCKFECMTAGALGAYVLFYEKSNILSVIYNRYTQIASFILVPVLIYWCPSYLQDGIHIPISFLFIIIILNVAQNRKSLIKPSNRFFHFLGKISYGIYMYHFVVVFAVIRFVYMNIGINDMFFFNILSYGLSITITIFISWLSYDLYEKRFIRKKEKFSKVKSG